MKLIVGLGNPGLLYAGTRHNIGFSVVKTIARQAGASFRNKAQLRAGLAKIKSENQDVMLALPSTYMNVSGMAVKAVSREYAIPRQNILVVCDDLDLAFGRLKLKTSGSSGGHKGIASIIEALGTQDFARLRIGIGRPQGYKQPRDYVLSAFNKKERIALKPVFERACLCCVSWVTQGGAVTMNIYNKNAVSLSYA